MHTNKDRMIMHYNPEKPQKAGIGKTHAYRLLFCKSSVFHISSSNKFIVVKTLWVYKPSLSSEKKVESKWVEYMKGGSVDACRNSAI